MARPSAKGFCRDRLLVSLLQRIRPRRSPLAKPRWRYPRLGPHKTPRRRAPLSTPGLPEPRFTVGQARVSLRAQFEFVPLLEGAALVFWLDLALKERRAPRKTILSFSN